MLQGPASLIKLILESRGEASPNVGRQSILVPNVYGSSSLTRNNMLNPSGRCQCIEIQKRPTKNIHEFVSIGVRTWPCLELAEDSAKRPELKA